MTDFLSSLMDRALARRPVLQRRRPSIFEPISEGPRLVPSLARRIPPRDEPDLTPDGLDDADDAVSAHPAGAHRSLTGPTGGAVPPRPDRSPDPTPSSSPRGPYRELRPAWPSQREPRDLAAPHDPGDARPRPAPSRPAPVGPVEGRAGTRLEGARPAGTPPPVAAPGPTTRWTTSIETIVETAVRRPRVELPDQRELQGREAAAKAALRPSPPAAAPPAPRPAPTVEHRPARSAAPFAAPSPAVEHREPRSDRAPAPSVRSPLAPVAPRARSRPVPAREPAPPPPAVHVTIGRIEIRATPPPAPAARTRPRAAPALSLEDYLSARARGAS